jgi:hypothetical protein
LEGGAPPPAPPSPPLELGFPLARPEVPADLPRTEAAGAGVGVAFLVRAAFAGVEGIGLRLDRCPRQIQMICVQYCTMVFLMTLNPFQVGDIKFHCRRSHHML